MRRPQKPFSVEVKRARKGAVSGTPVFTAKPALLDVPKAESPILAPPEREKPRRRILEAIEPDLPPAVVDEPHFREAAIAGASPQAESSKPRRGRPRKIALAPDASPVRANPVRAKSPTRTKSPARVNASTRAKSGARMESSAVFAPTRRESFAIAESAFVAPAPREANGAIASKPARPNNHVGHVTHAGRVEAASGLPRGERWKRRLPKVLW